ncbi:MAG: cytochrome c, partial [Planctomycetes bacterium]|nr:cytochrome c [Planctomycetota bacterium]
EMTGEGSTSAFREGMYYPEAKHSETYKHKLLPPDFTRHLVRSGTTPKELFRTIGSGIGGTAMPMWKGSITDEELWALSPYVASIIKQLDTPASHVAREKLLNQPPFVEPTATPAARAARLRSTERCTATSDTSWPRRSRP